MSILVGVATWIAAATAVADPSAVPAVAGAEAVGGQELAVDYVSFGASVKRGTVVLRWETASEIDNEGFNLLRRSDRLDELTVVNADLIPAAGGPVFGAQYEFVDDDVEPETTYFYLLEDVDTSGDVTYRGADACLYDAPEGAPACAPVTIKVSRSRMHPP